MRRHRIPAIATVLLALGGCGIGAGNVYEGARTSGDLQRTPIERQTQPSKPYDQYDRERPK